MIAVEESHTTCAVALSDHLVVECVQLAGVHAERVFPQALEVHRGLPTGNPCGASTVGVVDVMFDFALDGDVFVRLASAWQQH